jgi:hypothetical protein
MDSSYGTACLRKMRLVGIPLCYSHRLTEGAPDGLLTIEAFHSSRNLAREESSKESNQSPDDSTAPAINNTINDLLFSEQLFFDRRETTGLTWCVHSEVRVSENRLVIHIVPSFCHDCTAASFTEDLLLWAASGGVTRSLQVCHGSGTPLISLSLTSFSFPICAWIEEITRSIFPSNQYTMSSRCAYRQHQCPMSDVYDPSRENT